MPADFAGKNAPQLGVPPDADSHKKVELTLESRCNGGQADSAAVTEFRMLTPTRR